MDGYTDRTYFNGSVSSIGGIDFYLRENEANLFILSLMSYFFNQETNYLYNSSKGEYYFDKSKPSYEQEPDGIDYRLTIVDKRTREYSHDPFVAQYECLDIRIVGLESFMLNIKEGMSAEIRNIPKENKSRHYFEEEIEFYAKELSEEYLLEIINRKLANIKSDEIKNELLRILYLYYYNNETLLREIINVNDQNLVPKVDPNQLLKLDRKY